MARAARIPAACPDGPLPVNASLPLLTRLDEAMAFSNAVHDPRDVGSLHALRIAVKRLRYTLEILAAVVPDSDDFLQTLKGLQDTLGAIHDADVLTPVLEADMAREGETPGVRALLELTRAERHETYQRFIAEWEAQNQNGFARRLRQAALDAGRLAAEPSPRDMREDISPDMQAALAESIALLRLVPFSPRARPRHTAAIARAVSQLTQALPPDATGPIAENALKRGNRRLAAALRKAAR